MSIEKLLLFILACLLEALVPENNFFMITAQSLKYGYRSTIWGILGVASAQVLLLLLFAFSFNLLQNKFHSFYNFIRITGSIYIIIVGIEIFYVFFRSRKTTTIKPARKGELFIQGFSSHISNPKAVLLWTALIPQVLPTYTVSIFYPLLLGTISIFTEFCILNSYAWLAHTGGNFLVNTRLSAVREFISGSFFLCLGTYLLLLSLRF